MIQPKWQNSIYIWIWIINYNKWLSNDMFFCFNLLWHQTPNFESPILQGQDIRIPPRRVTTSPPRPEDIRKLGARPCRCILILDVHQIWKVGLHKLHTDMYLYVCVRIYIYHMKIIYVLNIHCCKLWWIWNYMKFNFTRESHFSEGCWQNELPFQHSWSGLAKLTPASPLNTSYLSIWQSHEIIPPKKLMSLRHSQLPS